MKIPQARKKIVIKIENFLKQSIAHETHSA